MEVQTVQRVAPKHATTLRLGHACRYNWSRRVAGSHRSLRKNRKIAMILSWGDFT